jgi:ketosteroid isomerase-like protein
MTSKPGDSVLQVIDAYKSAVFAKDLEAFIALYHPEVCVLDLWAKWSYRGVNAWRTAVTEWFGSLGTERVIVDMDVLQSFATDGLVVVSAFAVYKGVSAEGKDLRAMRNRLTWALTPSPAAWKIVHEHTSAPLKPLTSKVMLGTE